MYIDPAVMDTTIFIAERIKDGTKSNVIGNIVAGIAVAAAAVVAGMAVVFSVTEFGKKKGNLKRSMPEVLGIWAGATIISLICLKVPDMLGMGRTFLSDFLPF